MAGIPSGRLSIEIVAEVARLQADLDKCKSAVKAASKDIAASARHANDNLATMGGGLAGLGKNSQLASHHLQNLGFQLNDMVVGLASGQKPLTVLLQQGSQVAGIMSQAGVGVGGLTKQVAAMVGRFAMAHPVMLGLGAAAGVAYGAFKLFQSSVSHPQEMEAYAKALGMTTEELEKAGGAGATFGDIMSGVWKTLKDAMNLDAAFAAVKKGFAAFGQVASNVLNAVLQLAANVAAGYFAAWAGSFDAIKILWTRFPAIIGNVLSLAANLGISAVEGMINKSIGGLNKLIEMSNAAVAAVGLPWKIGTIGAVNFGRVAVQSAGAAAGAAADIGNAYAARFGQAKAAGNAFIASAKAGFATLDDNISESTRARIKAADQANDAAKKATAATKGHSKAANDNAKAMKDQADAAKALAAAMAEQERAFLASLHAGQEFAEKLYDDIRAMTMTAEQMKRLAIDAEVLRLTMDALAATSDGQRDALLAQAAAVRQAGQAWQETAAAMAAIKALPELVPTDSGLPEALDDTLDKLDAIADRAAVVGNIMRDAFGDVGGAIGDAVSNFADYQAAVEALEQSNATQAQKEVTLGTLRAKNTASLIGGVKSLFKEHSTAWRIMGAVEKAHAAMQLVNMIKSMAMDTAMTGKSLINSALRATAKGVEAIANAIASLPFPLNIAAGIATAAALVGFGVKVAGGGGGGGGSSIPPTSAEDLQKAAGTGTVLGSSDAKSASIANALDIMARNSNDDLEYQNEAVQHLRAIDTGISGLTAALARQLNVSGGAFDTSSFNLGTNSSGGLLGIGGLFSSTKTTSLFDQGLKFFQSTVGDILMQGVQAQIYNVIQTVKKSSGFLGIGGSTKTTYTTTTGAAPAQIEQQFQLILSDVAQGVIAFGRQLGLDVTDYVASAVIPSAQLSFLNMSGEDIQAALEAYFSSVADAITAGAFGSAGLNLEMFQRAGEGLFETLARITRTMMTVSGSLNSIGMAGALGGGDLTARAQRSDSLVGLFGGMDEFQDAIGNFSKAFLTEAEQMAPVIAAVRGEMARLGQASVDTRDEFKALVMGLDLSTDSGQAMFAALMAVAPAFAKVDEYLAKLNGTAGETGKTLEQLAAIEKQRRSLEIELMSALGDTAGAVAAKRADDLAAMDESLRALQSQVWAAQDAAQAAKDLAAATQAEAAAADALARQKRGLEIDLMTAIGDTAGAVAAQRALELEALDASLRPLKEQIFAAQDAAAAAEELARATQAQADADTAAAEVARRAAEDALALAKTIADQRRSIEIELMDALGQSEAALAARRMDELAALDESNRALKQAVFDAQDAATAAEALARAHEAEAQAAKDAADAAAALAQTRRGLEIELMTAIGDTAGAVAAQRADELAALDASLRPMQEAIYAANDAATAAEALARAHEQEVAAADAAAQAAANLARQRRDLEIQLMEALGDAEGALAARRTDQLAALDASLQPLQAQIFAAQDAAAAQKALAEAQEDAARQAKQAMDEMQRAAEEAARAAADLARQRTGLEIELMRALGNETGALAAQRALELSTIDASLVGLQQQVWAAQDAAAAQKALADAQAEAERAADEAAKAQAQRVADARSVLTDAYKREAGALGETIERFQAFGASLREFRAGLFAASAGTANAYRQAQVKFITTSALAQTGDVKALGELQGVSSAFLDASRAQASTAAQYQRDVAAVARAVDAAIGAADTAVDTAQAQLTALQQLVSGYVTLNESVISVHDAIVALEAVLADELATSPGTPELPAYAPGTGGTAPMEGGAGTGALQVQVDALTAKLDRLVAAAEKTAEESEATNVKYLRRVIVNDKVTVDATL